MRAPSRCSRLALLALGLYPLAFRRRYGQEMRALLDETPARAKTVLNLLRGALLAHVRPPAAVAALVGPADRVRASASGVLACWVAFAAAGFAFYKTTENFIAAGRAHPLLGDAYVSVEALALVGSAALILGALPLTIAALVRARREPRLRLIVSVPPLAVLLFVGLTAGVMLFARSRLHHPTTFGGVVFIAWGLAGLACGAGCVVAARKALFGAPTAPRRLIAAFISGTLVTAAMAAMTAAAALYAIALPVDASPLASGANGPLQAVSAEVSLVLIVLVMAIATALAAVATGRGWRAAGQLRTEGAGVTL